MHIRGVQKIENLSAVGGREWRQKFGGTCQTCRFHMIDLFSFIFFLAVMVFWEYSAEVMITADMNQTENLIFAHL